jgi:hypothetical protein
MIGYNDKYDFIWFSCKIKAIVSEMFFPSNEVIHVLSIYMHVCVDILIKLWELVLRMTQSLSCIQKNHVYTFPNFHPLFYYLSLSLSLLHRYTAVMEYFSLISTQETWKDDGTSKEGYERNECNIPDGFYVHFGYLGNLRFFSFHILSPFCFFFPSLSSFKK